jgi:hypothetical protein
MYSFRLYHGDWKRREQNVWTGAFKRALVVLRILVESIIRPLIRPHVQSSCADDEIYRYSRDMNSATVAPYGADGML